MRFVDSPVVVIAVEDNHHEPPDSFRPVVDDYSHPAQVAAPVPDAPAVVYVPVQALGQAQVAAQVPGVPVQVAVPVQALGQAPARDGLVRVAGLVQA